MKDQGGDNIENRDDDQISRLIGDIFGILTVILILAYVSAQWFIAYCLLFKWKVNVNEN